MRLNEVVQSDDISALYYILQREDHQWIKDFHQNMESGDQYPTPLAKMTDHAQFETLVINTLYQAHRNNQRQWDILVWNLWKYHLKKIGKEHLL